MNRSPFRGLPTDINIEEPPAPITGDRRKRIHLRGAILIGIRKALVFAAIKEGARLYRMASKIADRQKWICNKQQPPDFYIQEAAGIAKKSGEPIDNILESMYNSRDPIEKSE